MHDVNTFSNVFAFNELIVKIPPKGIGSISPEQLVWAEKAYLEEIQELKDAHSVGDVVGQIDASLDLIYFAMGTLYKLGLTSEEAAECMGIVHECNMRKKRGDKGRGSGEDAVKPEDWVGPEEQIAAVIARRQSHHPV